MDALREEVERLFIDGALRTGEDAVVFSARQAAALSDCADALCRVAGSLAAGLTADICAEVCAWRWTRWGMSAGAMCGRMSFPRFFPVLRREMSACDCGTYAKWG